jgi:hypothetical protein
VAAVSWAGGFYSPEPPEGVDHVRDDHDGKVMDRLGDECYDCGQGHSMWRWRHNGGTECWNEMDGIGPWTEVGPAVSGS